MRVGRLAGPQIKPASDPEQGIYACLEQKMRSFRRDLEPFQVVTPQFPVFLGTGNVSKQNRE
jgi:hypothetical protein